jgi:hypothetical protein
VKDIAGIMEIASDQLSFDELGEKIKEYGLQQQWEKAKGMTV